MNILDYINKINEIYGNQEPRITAQEPRNMELASGYGSSTFDAHTKREAAFKAYKNYKKSYYSGRQRSPIISFRQFLPIYAKENYAEGGEVGQLVQNTADGSRPGYSGVGKKLTITQKNILKQKFPKIKFNFKDYPSMGLPTDHSKYEAIRNFKGTQHYTTGKEYVRTGNPIGSVGQFSKAELNRVARIKYPKTGNFEKLNKKQKSHVRSSLQYSSVAGTKITKKTIISPFPKHIQAKILAEFPDADFSKGKYGFTKATNNTKLAQVKAFEKRGWKPRFKEIPEKVQNELKEKFSHFKDWDFKKFKYGVPESATNIENRKLMMKVKTFINDPKPWKFGFSMDQKGAWMTGQMYRAWEHGNTDYEPKYNKNNKVIGMYEKGKLYYANKNVADIDGAKKFKLINSHPEFNKIQKFVDVANEAKLPLKDLKGYKNTKSLLALFPEGYENIKFSDLTNYLYREAGADATRNAIEKHHLKNLSDLGAPIDSKNLQLLRQDLNTLGNTIAQEIKKGDFSKVADLEKAGVKITVDGKTYGTGFQDPRRQLNVLIGETTKKIQSLDEKKFAQMISDLCPKKASGGRIGYQTAGSVGGTLDCGLNVIKNNNIKTEAQAKTMLKIAEAGSKSRALRGMLGVWGLGGEAIIEAGIGAYKVLGQGVPVDIAWSESYWSYLDPRKYTGELSDLRKKDLEKGNPRIAKYFDALGVLEERDYHKKWVDQMNPADPTHGRHVDKLNQYDEIIHNFYGGPEGIAKMMEKVQPEVDEAEAVQAGRWAADAIPSTEAQADRKQKQAMKELMASHGVKTMPYTKDGKPVYEIDKELIDTDLKMFGDYFGYGWTPYGHGFGMSDGKYDEDLGYKELVDTMMWNKGMENLSRGAANMAGGGIVGIRKPSAIPPESGPQSQGLASLKKYGSYY